MSVFYALTVVRNLVVISSKSSIKTKVLSFKRPLYIYLNKTGLRSYLIRLSLLRPELLYLIAAFRLIYRTLPFRQPFIQQTVYYYGLLNLRLRPYSSRNLLRQTFLTFVVLDALRISIRYRIKRLNYRSSHRELLGALQQDTRILPTTASSSQRAGRLRLPRTSVLIRILPLRRVLNGEKI